MTPEDFEREAERMRPMLLSAASGYLGNADDAEDAVQEVLVKLWAMAGTLRSPVAPLAKVLVRNFCIDRLRRRRVTVSVDDTALPLTAAESNDGGILEHIMKVIDTLPATQQIVLRLRHIDGMAMEDIARLTGNNEANVRKILSRARMAVRKHYMEDLNNEQ